MAAKGRGGGTTGGRKRKEREEDDKPSSSNIGTIVFTPRDVTALPAEQQALASWFQDGFLQMGNMITKSVGIFQTEITKKVSDNKKEIKTVKKKLDEEVSKGKKRDRRAINDRKDIDDNFETLSEEVEKLKQLQQMEDPAEVRRLWESLGVTCEVHARTVGLQPIDGRTTGELRDYLTTLGVVPTPNNIITWAVRNYMLNELLMTAKQVDILENGIRRIHHDGHHTAYVEFVDMRLVNMCFSGARNLTKSSSAIGKHFRKIRLRIVPQLQMNWKFHDDRGYQLRREFRERNEARGENEPKEFLQTRLMLLRKSLGWTYELQAKYEPGPDSVWYTVPIPKGMVEPGPDLRKTSLDDFGPAQEMLNWDDLPIEALKDSRAARVKSIKPRFKRDTINGKTPSREAMKEVWRALIRSDEDVEGDEWSTFDAENIEIDVPNDLPSLGRISKKDPLMETFAMDLRLIQIKEKLEAARISRDEARRMEEKVEAERANFNPDDWEQRYELERPEVQPRAKTRAGPGEPDFKRRRFARQHPPPDETPEAVRVYRKINPDSNLQRSRPPFEEPIATGGNAERLVLHPFRKNLATSRSFQVKRLSSHRKAIEAQVEKNKSGDEESNGESSFASVGDDSTIQSP